MHGDQYHRAVLGFMGLVALAQEQGQQNSLINGHGHTKFFFHCRSELHTNGIFLPVVLHHIQNTLIGQPLLCCLFCVPAWRKGADTDRRKWIPGILG